MSKLSQKNDCPLLIVPALIRLFNYEIFIHCKVIIFVRLFQTDQMVTAQKKKFSIKDFFSKCDQETVNLVTFTEEILKRKLHFLCSE